MVEKVRAMAVNGTVEAELRRSQMLERLASFGQLGLIETARELGVHEMTVRRDFIHLENVGQARRVRGGIVAVGVDDFSRRRNQAAGAKRVIAEKLGEFVDDGATIGLDASTTVHAMATTFPAVIGVSVVTNGLESFQALQGRSGVRVYLTGGEQDENVSLVGTLATQAIGNFNLDVCFLSAMSLDARGGTSESTLGQMAVKQALAEAAERVVLAVDSAKFETRSRVRSLGLDRVDVLVTELDPADPRLDRYRRAVSEIR